VCEIFTAAVVTNCNVVLTLCFKVFMPPHILYRFCARTEFMGGRGGMSPQLLDRGDIISFVPPTFCDKSNVVVQSSCYFTVGNLFPA